MERFLSRLKLNEDADCGIGAKVSAIMLENKRLKENGFPEIPQEWQNLLCEYNGIYCDGAEIFAVAPTEGMFADIEQMNLDIVWEKIDGVLLLGQNENDFLAFDGKYYLIVEQDSEDIRHQTENPEKALSLILKI